MKKLLVTATAALSLLLPGISGADIIFYKNGKIKHDVKSTQITMKLCSTCNDTLTLDRDKILGIQGYENGKLDISLKDDSGSNWDIGHSTTGDCVKITIRNKEGKEETVNGEDIEKYLFTNDIVPDKDIIKKYDFIKVAGQYYKSMDLTPGGSFFFYRDDVKERYLLVSIDNLKLAQNYENLQVYPSFDKEEIESLEQKLKSEGKDTYIAVVASAGCALTPFFVNHPNSQFVGTIFHEWWHENKRDLPLELNEAAATAVGLLLSEDFMSKHPEYKSSSLWGENAKTSISFREYSKIVVEYHDRLSKLYSSNKTDKEKLEIKEQILKEMKEKTGIEMNNAQISFQVTYCRYFNLVGKVVKSYKTLQEGINALKDIPPLDLERGVKYLEDLVAKNTAEKDTNMPKVINTY
ncbi:hypothetical protein FJZ53_06005 [Candidatus Woesearchaeota archaeon]|nr:hypothetical protein [Candidatus Woesearchaeota archaeon]